MLKIELLCASNENQIKLSKCGLLAIKRFNRFIILVYLSAWFTCNSIVEAPINDLKILNRLKQYNDKEIRKCWNKVANKAFLILKPRNGNSCRILSTAVMQ